MTQPDAQGATGIQQQPSDAPPPWGNDFDPQRAWDTIQNLRRREAELEKRPVLTDEQKQQLAEFDTWKKQNQTELEKAQGELTRWQADAETWRKAAVGSKIQALAAETFADPTDAVTALADKNFLDAGGAIDETAIKRELADVLKTKPHWAKPADQSPRAPVPNPAQGTSGTPVNGDPATEFGAILQNAMAR